MDEHRSHREMEIRRRRREVSLCAAYYGLLEETRTVLTVVHRKERAELRRELRTVRRLMIRTEEEDCCRMIRTEEGYCRLIRTVAEEVVDYRRNRNLGLMEDNQTW
jgi:hypothetical protein